MTLTLVLTTLALVCGGFAAPKEDAITYLPGVTWPLHFKQYSGYLQGEGTRKLHYWFVESEINPRNDPVVLWLNGGPGCSSVQGLLTENGPFRVQDNGKDLAPNPYSWNQITNVIYLESPAGVGFSYSADKNYTTDDDQVARNNYLALQDFFRKFPEYKQNDFYLSGESYAGIYVPTLSSLILDDPNFNLKGLIVGNGLLDNDMNTNSIVYFAYFHGLIDTTQWFQIVKDCCPGNDTESYCDFAAGSRKYAVCADQNDKIYNLVWQSGLNVYNLYSECAGGVKNHNLYYDERRGKFVTNYLGWPFMFLKDKVAKLKKELNLIPLSKLASTPPCTNSTAIMMYLNTPQVRAALHIPSDVQEWEECSTPVEMNYVRIYTTMTPLFQKALKNKLRILVYNGDIDMACNFLGDEWFVDSLHQQNPQPRVPWYYTAADGTKQVAGYAKTYDKITFVTVRGAGHMVPTDAPVQALKMYIKFIQNQPF